MTCAAMHTAVSEFRENQLSLSVARKSTLVPASTWINLGARRGFGRQDKEERQTKRCSAVGYGGR